MRLFFRVLSDRRDGVIHAWHTGQVQAGLEKTKPCNVRVRIDQARQHGVSLAVDARGVGMLLQQVIVTCGDDTSRVIDYEDLEFDHAIGR